MIQETRVWPNPVVDILKIECSNGISSIRITDINGKIMYSMDKANNIQSTEINISDLSDGIYIVHVFTGNNVVTNKIIKQ